MNISLKEVEQIVYFNSYVVIKSGLNGELNYKQLLTETDWAAFEYSHANKLDVEISIGAEAIKKLLDELDLEYESKKLRTLLPSVKGVDRDKDNKTVKDN